MSAPMSAAEAAFRSDHVRAIMAKLKSASAEEREVALELIQVDRWPKSYFKQSETAHVEYFERSFWTRWQFVTLVDDPNAKQLFVDFVDALVEAEPTNPGLVRGIFFNLTRQTLVPANDGGVTMIYVIPGELFERGANNEFMHPLRSIWEGSDLHEFLAQDHVRAS